MDFADESSATEAGEVLDAALTLARAAVPDERVEDLIRKVQGSVSGTRLTVRLEMEVQEITDLLGILEDGLPGIFGDRTSFTEERVVPRIVPPQPEPVPVPQVIPDREIIRSTVRHVPTMDSKLHITEEETVDYTTVPPTSGPHWQVPAQCGFYEQGLPDEQLVHNLEHANVVVSYNLPDENDLIKLRRLERRVEQRDWVIFRAYSKIRPGTVAMTAWGVIDTSAGVDDDKILAFITAYAGNPSSPELIPCR